MEGTIEELELVKRIFDRMCHDCLRQTFVRKGLSELTNPHLLFILQEERGKALSQKDLSDRAGVSPPTIAISLKRMERAGLVKRVADQSDQRRNVITLTAKGKTLTDHCRTEGMALMQKITAGFTQEEIASMCGYYRRMIGNMERLGMRMPTLL